MSVRKVNKGGESGFYDSFFLMIFDVFFRLCALATNLLVYSCTVFSWISAMMRDGEGI